MLNVMLGSPPSIRKSTVLTKGQQINFVKTKLAKCTKKFACFSCKTKACQYIMFEAKIVDQETEDNSVNCTLYASGWNNEGVRGWVHAQLTREILTTVTCVHAATG